MLVLGATVGAGAGGETVVARRDGAELEMERKAWEGEGGGLDRQLASPVLRCWTRWSGVAWCLPWLTEGPGVLGVGTT